MAEIRLPQLGRAIECRDGENLYEVLARENLIEGPCGGRGVCGKCRVVLDGRETLSCECAARGACEVLLPEFAGVGDIVSDGYMKAFSADKKEGFGFAVDIGTTTVVSSLYDLSSGRELASVSCLNSQKSCGQDVISRIRCAGEEEGGLKRLGEKITADLNALFTQLLARCGVKAEEIRGTVVAGNTTMIHLLAGRDPSSLAAAPYSPAFTGSLLLDGNALGLCVPAPVDCLPAIASYVGGDITAGVTACGITEDGPLTLFIDIGTNGEIVLAGGGEMYCCSCAAGPALEGMNISCGMRAAAGAIEEVSIKDGAFSIRTIKDGVPRGICGSGLLSAIASMLAEGVISPNGRFAAHPMVSEAEGGKRVVLAPEQGIYLTQKDIRQVQLVKGAILSGILTLLEASGRSEEEIEKVIVAGQFGAHLTTEALTGCGFLPKSLKEKIVYAGNTSKSGAAVCLLSAENRARCDRLAEGAKYIELSLKEGYEDLFVKCLRF